MSQLIFNETEHMWLKYFHFNIIYAYLINI